MKFQPQAPTLRLSELIRLVSQKGNEYYKVKLSDEQAFESREFYLTRGQSTELLKEGARYKVVFTMNLEGQLSAALTPEKATGVA